VKNGSGLLWKMVIKNKEERGWEKEGKIMYVEHIIKALGQGFVGV